MSRQIKGLGVYNDVTCLGPYLAHLYIHFHEMDVKKKEASKKCKALIQTVSDSDTETEPEDKKEPEEEVSRVFCEAEAVARNMKEMFTPPLVVETDLQLWKEMVRNLPTLLTEEQRKTKVIVEQRDYFKGEPVFREDSRDRDVVCLAAADYP
ncbi:hypothetical protein R1flu_028868 [Riccia fluitans]|uniref:Uncharacterized protein n=1 Tax=Riccia fluitans TaxID=41844 RepID=A0ABD1XMX1_9MARC